MRQRLRSAKGQPETSPTIQAMGAAAKAGLLLMLVLLPGCTHYRSLDDGARVPWARSMARQEGGPLQSGDYRVAAGDTLGWIASFYDLPVEELAAANNIPPPYRLYPGEILSIPARDPRLAETAPAWTRAAPATAAPFDYAGGAVTPAAVEPVGRLPEVLTAKDPAATLPDTSDLGERRFPSVDQEASALASREPEGTRRATFPDPRPIEPSAAALPDLSDLGDGSSGNAAITQRPLEPAAPAPRRADRERSRPGRQLAAIAPDESMPAAAPADGETYVVAQGDTLDRVADRFHMSLGELIAANGLQPPYQIKVGQTLLIPLSEKAARERLSVRSSRRPDQEIVPPPLSGEGFVWPTKGTVVEAFDSSGADGRTDGIVIASSFGAPVRATESGVVVYADEALKGYGRMLLIRHGEGYVSAYAHNHRLLVQEGDEVRRGQMIATVGQTGDAPRPQLLFELRMGTEPIDPLTRLGPLEATVASQR